MGPDDSTTFPSQRISTVSGRPSSLDFINGRSGRDLVDGGGRDPLSAVTGPTLWPSLPSLKSPSVLPLDDPGVDPRAQTRRRISVPEGVTGVVQRLRQGQDPQGGEFDPSVSGVCTGPVSLFVHRDVQRSFLP